ncbi:unnamed protein product [Thelazia callipaeda]|uniref:Conserved oligomeric Golgi complex subunit 4 n=1 Tax=Thelazia callipaeda TaxID=103827 RepID=A0A0N5CQ77_THECL|nr:unnamed protein product [Thelazia callipaeda]
MVKTAYCNLFFVIEFGKFFGAFRRQMADKANEEEAVFESLERILPNISTNRGNVSNFMTFKKIFRNYKFVEQGISLDNSRPFNLAFTRLKNQMTLVGSDTKQLASKLKMICGLADNISSKVLALDVAKGRVVECLQRVNDLMDLCTCADGVRSAIEQEDYELAARHIHKFLTLDTSVFRLSDQEEGKSDDGHSMGKSYEILRESAAEMILIIEKRFDQAVENNDIASIQRFFKLFPFLNQYEAGIERIGDYICSEIRKFAKRNSEMMLAGGIDERRVSVLYADSLTMLFEGNFKALFSLFLYREMDLLVSEIARQIQVYEPLIISCYGPDKLLSLIEILQASRRFCLTKSIDRKECDSEAERIIDAFTENRQFDSKAKAVGKLIKNLDKHVSVENVSLRVTYSLQFSILLLLVLDKIDALELDILLSEVTLMHSRTNLYWRYLKRRLNAANMKTDEQQNSVATEMSFGEAQRFNTTKSKQKQERSKKLDDLVLRSALGTKLQELLGNYILMEQFYMKESVAKAMIMDLKEAGSLTRCSMLDDVFFIVRKCIIRSLSSSSVDCTCAVLNNGVTALDMDFLKYIYQGIKNGYPGVGWTAEAYQTAQTAYNVIQHGKTVAVSGPEKQKEIFLMSLNNVRASAECTRALKKGILEDFQKNLTELNEVEKGKLENATSQLDDLVRKFDSSANVGIDKLCTAAFRPKLKPIMDLYLDVTHTPSETEFANFEADNPFIDNFIATLDRQFAAFESLLIPANHQELLAAVCAEISMQFERVIMKSLYNRLGGLQLDKDFRTLSSYLTNIAGWIVREKCTRLSQIVSIINVDSVEEAEECFHQSQLHNCILTSNEAMKILVLRIDLPSDAIKNASF